MKQLTLLAGILATSYFCLSGCVPVVAAGAAGTVAADSAGDSITVGKQVDDAWIRTKINKDILDIPELTDGKSNVNPTVFNGIVLLLGQVPTEAVKTQLAKQVSEIDGVRIVYNQLTVGPSEGVKGYAGDTWISAKVKTNMVGRVNLFHFTVVTEQGVVYLMGRVTKAEGDEAGRADHL